MLLDDRGYINSNWRFDVIVTIIIVTGCACVNPAQTTTGLTLVGEKLPDFADQLFDGNRLFEIRIRSGGQHHRHMRCLSATAETTIIGTWLKARISRHTRQPSITGIIRSSKNQIRRLLRARLDAGCAIVSDQNLHFVIVNKTFRNAVIEGSSSMVRTLSGILPPCWNERARRREVPR